MCPPCATVHRSGTRIVTDQEGGLAGKARTSPALDRARGRPRRDSDVRLRRERRWARRRGRPRSERDPPDPRTLRDGPGATACRGVARGRPAYVRRREGRLGETRRYRWNGPPDARRFGHGRGHDQRAGTARSRVFTGRNEALPRPHRQQRRHSADGVHDGGRRRRQFDAARLADDPASEFVVPLRRPADLRPGRRPVHRNR